MLGLHSSHDDMFILGTYPSLHCITLFAVDTFLHEETPVSHTVQVDSFNYYPLLQDLAVVLLEHSWENSLHWEHDLSVLSN